MNMVARAVFGILALVGPGCAAMFSGTSDPVMFTSEPAGALITSDDEQHTTPCTIELSKGVSEFTIAHAAHEERVVEIDRSFQGGYLLMDILFTPGFGVKRISMRRYPP